jgi:hypothetical protein
MKIIYGGCWSLFIHTNFLQAIEELLCNQRGLHGNLLNERLCEWEGAQAQGREHG